MGIYRLRIIFIIYKIQFKEIFTQLKYIIPIWLVGFFWSVESAIYVTSIIGTYLLSFIFFRWFGEEERKRIADSEKRRRQYESYYQDKGPELEDIPT